MLSDTLKLCLIARRDSTVVSKSRGKTSPLWPNQITPEFLRVTRIAVRECLENSPRAVVPAGSRDSYAFPDGNRRVFNGAHEGSTVIDGAVEANDRVGSRRATRRERYAAQKQDASKNATETSLQVEVHGLQLAATSRSRSCRHPAF